MAWSYNQNFNSLNIASLVGQDSWTGLNTEPTVQSSVYFDVLGTKAVELVNPSTGESQTKRSVTSANSGTVYFAMRRTVNNAGDSYTNFRANSGADNRFGVTLKSDGKIYFNGSSDTQLSASYSINTWYVFRIDFDATGTNTADVYSLNTITGVTIDSLTGKALAGTGAIDSIWLRATVATSTNYWDSISATSIIPILATINESVTCTDGTVGSTLEANGNESVVTTDTSDIDKNTVWTNQNKSIDPTWTNQEK